MDNYQLAEKLEALANVNAGDVGIREDGRFRIPAKGKQAAETVANAIQTAFSVGGIEIPPVSGNPWVEVSGPNVLLDLRTQTEAKLMALGNVDLNDLKIRDTTPKLRGVGQQIELDRAETKRRVDISESIGDLLRRGQVFLLNENEYGVEATSNYAAREMAAIINEAETTPFARVLDKMLVLEMETDTSTKLLLIEDLKGPLQLKARLQAGEEALAVELAAERNAEETAHRSELLEARRILKEGPQGGKGRGR